MKDKTIMAVLLMGLVLALCIVLQQVAIFTLGYELSQLEKDRADLQSTVHRQELVVQELISPAVLAQRQRSFDIALSPRVEWSEGGVGLEDAVLEKVASE